MTVVRLNDGREVEVGERTAKILVREGKGHFVFKAPKAAAIRHTTTYVMRHPELHDR